MTLINHRYRFVFVHIPKNAGTSVATALAPLTTYRDQEIGGTELGQAIAPHFRKRFGIGKHATLREIMELIGAAEASTYRSFCVTRHPVERAASTFSFLRRWTAWQTLAAYSDHVSEFVACATLDAFITSDFFATPGPDRLFLPQMDWITGTSGQLVGVDRVIRMDRLQDGLRRFLAEVGVPAASVDAIDVPRINTSRREVESRLSDQAIGILATRYALDFEHLDYPAIGSE